MRVLHFLPWLGNGGVETRLLQQLRTMRAPDYQHLVVCITALERAALVREAGVPVVELGGEGSIRNLRALAGLVREVRRFRPHVLHARVFEGQVFGSLAGYLGADVAVITEETTVPAPPRGRSLLTRAALRVLLHGNDALVAISPAAQRYLVEDNWFPAAQVHLNNNGIDVADTPAARAQAARERAAFGFGDAVVFGTACRLDDVHKRVTDVIRALKQVPGAALVVVGDGEDRAKCEELVDSLGLRERVRFTGYRHDSAVFYRLMDCFVMTPAFEGFGNVFSESAQVGLPAIGTSVGGIPDVVVHGETGLLVPPGDVEAIAQAMRQLVGDASLRQRLGGAAQRRAHRHFTGARNVEALRVLYDEVRSQRPPRA